jgi:hypothetical protein
MGMCVAIGRMKEYINGTRNLSARRNLGSDLVAMCCLVLQFY